MLTWCRPFVFPGHHQHSHKFYISLWLCHHYNIAHQHFHSSSWPFKSFNQILWKLTWNGIWVNENPPWLSKSEENSQKFIIPVKAYSQKYGLTYVWKNLRRLSDPDSEIIILYQHPPNIGCVPEEIQDHNLSGMTKRTPRRWGTGSACRHQQ